MLIIEISNVSTEEYDSFITKLQSRQPWYPQTVIKTSMNTNIQGYRYGLNFGFGEGAIRVDFRHNRLKDDEQTEFKMRVEFNPSKLHLQSYDYKVEYEDKTVKKSANPSSDFFEIMNSHFNKSKPICKLTGRNKSHVRYIKGMDVAFDFPCKKEDLVVTPLTGREPSLYRGTRYWGARNNHGYSKVYDKKVDYENKKKQAIKKGKPTYKTVFDDYENITRFEYTFKFDAEIGIVELDRIKDFNINNEYMLTLYDDSYFDGKKFNSADKAHLLCVINGLMNYNEMSRRYKENTKKILEQMGKCDIDQILRENWKKTIIETIKKYIRG